MGGFGEIGPIDIKKSATDFVAFQIPAIDAELIRVRLPGGNSHKKTDEAFVFDFGRSAFETPAARKKAIDAENQARLRAEEARLARAETDRIAGVEKLMDAELSEYRGKIAAIERKKKQAADDAEAARLAAIEAKLPKVSRRNYNKLYTGIGLDEAQDILGPAKENASSGGTQIVTWQSSGFLSVTIISATFQNGKLVSKAIVGD